MPHCPRCARQVTPGWTHCPDCGTALAGPRPGYTDVGSAPATGRGPSTGLVVGGALVAVLVVAAIGAGTWFGLSGDRGEPAPTLAAAAATTTEAAEVATTQAVAPQVTTPRPTTTRPTTTAPRATGYTPPSVCASGSAVVVAASAESSVQICQSGSSYVYHGTRTSDGASITLSASRSGGYYVATNNGYTYLVGDHELSLASPGGDETTDYFSSWWARDI